MTRKEASAKGLKHYYTGKPCSKGHDSIRYVANGVCAACDHQLYKRRAEPGADLVAQLTVATLAKGGAHTADVARSLGLHWFKRRTTCGHDIVHLDGVRCANHGDCNGVALDHKEALALLG